MSLDNLKSIIKLGETTNLEFKTSTTKLKEACQTLCAFLNAKRFTCLNLTMKNVANYDGSVLKILCSELAKFLTSLWRTFIFCFVSVVSGNSLNMLKKVLFILSCLMFSLSAVALGSFCNDSTIIIENHLRNPLVITTVNVQKNSRLDLSNSNSKLSPGTIIQPRERLFLNVRSGHGTHGNAKGNISLKNSQDELFTLSYTFINSLDGYGDYINCWPYYHLQYNTLPYNVVMNAISRRQALIHAIISKA